MSLPSPRQTHTIQDYCQAHRIKLTKNRQLVLDALFDSKQAVSAYELVNQIESQYHKKIPVMTVYRVLEFLQQHHLVHKISSMNKYIACSSAICKAAVPQFLVCQKCNLVQEVSIDQQLFGTLEEQVRNAGFHLQGAQMELSCICHQCRGLEN